MKVLSKEQIQAAAPSVFTKTALKSNVSKHYVHIPTERVIDDMEKLNWFPVNATQVKARKRQGFQKHMITFQNPNLKIEGKDGDTVIPQILISNSHDGTNAFRFEAGIFRLVCSNGLVIKDEDFGSLKIRHMGYNVEELSSTVNEIVERLPLTLESMNRLRSKEMDVNEQQKFALEAIGLRFGAEGLEIDVEDVLEPTRKEDELNDVWTVMNRVQEALVHGNFNYRKNNKVRKARRIKNFQQDVKLNKELWELAESYV